MARLAGLALIVVGVLYKLDINDYTSAIPDDYQNIGLAPTLTIIIGSVIFVIAFFGCCGAIRESTCLLTTVRINHFVHIFKFYLENLSETNLIKQNDTCKICLYYL
ncbi:hypothetical protein NQ314_002414 [Rhamnusium bicolor]|uniref:Uncharacterized protein n=1 Tax=Rhamnusium bicolor TaxID=1586634 RepID=A0AAV8ZSZ1_9CUCU|nr:hypothetical protein NQ314_002414 [Rhamnusium bicolor]